MAIMHFCARGTKSHRETSHLSCTVLNLTIWLALAAAPALAQYRASIQGVVTDAQRAMIPGASLALTDLTTNLTLRLATENLWSGNIWKWFMANPEPQKAMQLAGIEKV